jgi:hypothetical protein
VRLENAVKHNRIALLLHHYIGIYFCGVYADMTKQFTCGIDVTPCGQDEGYKNVTALS